MTQINQWTSELIQRHINEGLPLASLFRIEIVEATAEKAVLRLNEGEHVRRPGGSVAGPIQFSLADVATYALILASRQDPASVTLDMTINFLRPAMTLPLLAEATPLRAGRRLFTAEVRVSEAASRKIVAHATTTYVLSGQP